MTNRPILREIDRLGMVFVNGGYRRGGYLDVPGMWLFNVEFKKPPEGFLRCDGVVDAENVEDAIRELREIYRFWTGTGEEPPALRAEDGKETQ